MSSIGTNSPDNPFGPAGRANGQPQSTLNGRGLDGQGNPAGGPGQPRNEHVNGGAQPSRPSGGNRTQNIGQLAQSIGSMELSNQDDLYAFCEAYRSILNYLAVSAKLAEGQLKAAARAQARQARGGWMSPAQIVKLVSTLRRTGKDIDQIAHACVEGAAGAVKAWRRFETLLDELENGDSGGKFRRPGGGRRGFEVV